MEIPRHMRDPEIEKLVGQANRQALAEGDDIPVELVLKNSQVRVGKEYDPVSSRWFTVLRMRPRRGKGDTEYVLQLDSLNAESISKALAQAAAYDPTTQGNGKG